MSAQPATTSPRKRSSAATSPPTDRPASGRKRATAPLEVVEPRRAVVRTLGTVALVSIFGVLLLMAMFHALIVQGQRELDRVNAGIDAAVSTNDRLQLELAEMEAPDRIVAAARAYGMVDAPEVVYLNPENTGQEASE